jgi:ankyrin repeat protein
MTKLTANDGHSESRLHEEAWSGHVEGVSEVLNGGFDVNWVDSIGESALFGAVAWNRMEVVLYLISRGAEVNLKNIDEWTPLHWAASHGGPLMIETLLANGADPNARSKAGEKPIDIARRYGKGAHVAILKKVTSKL